MYNILNNQNSNNFFIQELLFFWYPDSDVLNNIKILYFLQFWYVYINT